MNAPKEYEQTDPRWRNIMYSCIGNRADTIGNTGCGPTCAAMVVATLRDARVTPIEAAGWSVQHGHLSPHDGTYWSYFKAYFDKWDIPCERTDSPDRAEWALSKGLMVISAMGKGLWTSGGHFILGYGLAGNKVKIHDPNSEASYRELGDLARYKAEGKQFWIVKEDWNVQIKSTDLVNATTGAVVKANTVTVNGNTFVKLRDTEKFLPVEIGYNGKNPTFKVKEDSMKYYEQMTELPDWAQPTIQKVIDKGVLKGDGSGLHLSEENMKMFIYMDRLGLIK